MPDTELSRVQQLYTQLLEITGISLLPPHFTYRVAALLGDETIEASTSGLYADPDSVSGTVVLLTATRVIWVAAEKAFLHPERQADAGQHAATVTVLTWPRHTLRELELRGGADLFWHDADESWIHGATIVAKYADRDEIVLPFPADGLPLEIARRGVSPEMRRALLEDLGSR